MKKDNDIISLDDLTDKEYREKGTAKRDKFEQGYEEFKSDALTKSPEIIMDTDTYGIAF